MKPMFYSGATGLLAQQKAMDTIGHNLANVNTTAFKKQNISFDSLLYKEMYVNAESEPISGNGVKAVYNGIELDQGGIVNTESPLNFAIMGDGFFSIENGDETQYTRSGVFAISMDGDTPLLATIDGYAVLDQKGKEIELEYEEDSVNLDYSLLKEQIGLYRFSNPSALMQASGGRYIETEASGEAEDASDFEGAMPRLVQRALESSNASTASEMVNMISAQRSYQLSARVIQTADENEQIINSLRK